MNVIEAVYEKNKGLADTLKERSGLRRLLVEDLYPDSAHFIYELLQNAEDTGATEAAFILSKNGLTFEHDGREFDESDIRAITDIGAGTKADDDDQIGRFGIGFKAVFGYTETPRIWSPTHSFEISEMVLPSVLEPCPDLEERTRYELPFNSDKKSGEKAFSEVRDGLEEISNKTLLFLSNMEMINLRIEDTFEGRLLRIPHSNHHIEILRDINDRRTESSHFLRFSEKVKGLDRQHVSIAFELEPLISEEQQDESKRFCERFRVIPAKSGGRVATYFTMAKETSNLRFHLHAPFVPEVSRASIKQTQANEPLFRQLAEFTARSLSTIRDLGLFNRDFLAVLPNDHDEIPENYAVIRDAIIKAMNTCPLTPTHSGGHAPAQRLLQAGAPLKKLLDRTDISFLRCGDDDRDDWVIGAQQRNSSIDRFLKGLDIEEWGVEQFVETVLRRFCERFFRSICRDEYTGPCQSFLDWMHQKQLSWHLALYALLHEELDRDRHSLRKFEHIRIVRCFDGQYRTGKDCYFPTPGTQEDPVHPRVAEEAYTGGGSEREQKNARKFLEKIGVLEVGERQQIEAILEQRYLKSEQFSSWENYMLDLKRFIAFFEENNKASLFRDYFIFQGADDHWYRPSDLYIDSPYQNTGLRAYYEPLQSNKARTELCDRLNDIEGLVRFAEACGVVNQLEITEIDCSNNPRKAYLMNAPGNIFTKTGIDQDYTILELKDLFDRPNAALSHLVWRTLSDRPQERKILKATYRKNQSNVPHYADSQLVLMLQEAAWIPQRSDEFVRPSDAARDLLPPDFQYDPSWPWLDAVNFGEATKEHNDSDDEGELVKILGDLEKLPLVERVKRIERIKKIAAEDPASNGSSVNLPEQEPNDPERRAKRVQERAREAPERKTEIRPRAVSVNRDAVKRDGADTYLRGLYTDLDGEMICQACRSRLPFKLPDGHYYFETVEFLPELERHHYQNYLALCPNHAAMVKHANNSKDDMMDLFRATDDNELVINLAGQEVVLCFTGTHITDLKTIIEVDNEDAVESEV